LKIEPVAVTYAKALVELASEADTLQPILEEIRFLSGLLDDEPDFRVFIESPAIDSEAKRKSLENIFRGKMSDLLLNFLVILIEKKRQFLLPQVLDRCEALYNELTGQESVVATSAVPLNQEQRERLEKALKGKLKKNVVLENRVRPEILGGLVLRYGDIVADGSIRTALEKMGGQMASGKLGSELVHEN